MHRIDAVGLCGRASASHAQDLLTASRHATPQVCRRRAVSLPALTRTNCGGAAPPSGTVRGADASRADARGDRLPRPASRAGALRRLRTQRAPGPRRPRRSRPSSPGVSAHVELVRARAADAGADLVLVHHGLFWRGMPHADRRRRCTAGSSRSSTHGMALAAYHLPLDGHPRARQQRAAGRRASAAPRPSRSPSTTDAPIGVAGTFGGDGITLDELVDARQRPDRARAAGAARGPRARPPRSASSPARGADYVADAAELRARRLPHRRARGARRRPSPARSGVHFIAAGHHATETLGVRRLGDLLAEKLRDRAHASSTSPTRSRHVALTDPLSTSVTSATNGFACRTANP